MTKDFEKEMEEVIKRSMDFSGELVSFAVKEACTLQLCRVVDFIRDKGEGELASKVWGRFRDINGYGDGQE